MKKANRTVPIRSLMELRQTLVQENRKTKSRQRKIRKRKKRLKKTDMQDCLKRRRKN